MSILVDSSLIIAFLHRRDQRHKDAAAMLPPILNGARGPAAITDYVVDEVLTFLIARGVDKKSLDQAIAFLLGDGKDPGAFVLHPIGTSDFAAALQLVRRHRARRLSFTDCASIAVMQARGIAAIASFDRGFDGVVERIGPDS